VSETLEAWAERSLGPGWGVWVSARDVPRARARFGNRERRVTALPVGLVVLACSELMGAPVLNLHTVCRTRRMLLVLSISEL